MIYKIFGLGGNTIEATISNEADEPQAKLTIKVDEGLVKEFNIPDVNSCINVYLDADDVYNLIGALHTIKGKI